jgi:hypothetical protein
MKNITVNTPIKHMGKLIVFVDQRSCCGVSIAKGVATSAEKAVLEACRLFVNMQGSRPTSWVLRRHGNRYEAQVRARVKRCKKTFLGVAYSRQRLVALAEAFRKAVENSSE